MREMAKISLLILFLTNSLHSLIHVPLARLSKRQIKTKIKPWLTKDLLDLMKVRDKLYRDFKNVRILSIKIFSFLNLNPVEIA